MHSRLIHLLLISSLFILLSCKTTEVPPRWESDYSYEGMEEMDIAAHIAVEKYLTEHYSGRISPTLNRLVRITRVKTDTEAGEIEVHFNNRLAEYPIRPSLVASADSAIRSHLPDVFQSFILRLFSMDEPLQELIPNYYREDPAYYDYSRLPISDEMGIIPFIRNEDHPHSFPNGLNNRHIALWHSHGWYYNQQLGRWKWQRPRLFRTTEDMLPMAFTLPYIVPMLEAAGATVWMPRERDTQHNEVVVVNDPQPGTGIYQENHILTETAWRNGPEPGFSLDGKPLRARINPFRTGITRVSVTDTVETATVEWTPVIPETGDYAVYVSYARSDRMPDPLDLFSETGSDTSGRTGSAWTAGTDGIGLPASDTEVQLENPVTTDALYTVYHAGGQTSFRVNQQLGGGTWVYLGHFRFREGQNPAAGSVRLSNRSAVAGNRITADAVRFGGGMGVVERAGRTSGRPKYLEGARYYLQYAGMPDSLVWSLNYDDNDYSDDFQSRGEWVNYLRGAPYGPNRNRNSGLGIPVELSLAFHTDAGVTRTDSTIGTLSIYSYVDVEDDLFFPDGKSRLSNRDLSDIMQTQIVDDIRLRYDTTWTRRALRNSRYSESMRPNVPSVLLELLSHQNFRDMQYALDPRFRFDVARSIYKSMLRFVATQHGYPYVVQPLPVTHMMSEPEGGSMRISWRAQPDPLEPTADPDAYILYTRIEDGGFDNGRLVNNTSVLLTDLEPGLIYSFKVRAVNRGGAGFPSEILAASIPPGDGEPVLIINGFTRISGPASIVKPGFKGFAGFQDAGVPDRYDISFTGDQYNFNAWEPWIENDQPGHGASYGDYETRIIPGNTFDFARIHGEAIREAGFGFVTISEAAVEDGLVDPQNYRIVNLILGNQRQIRNQTSYADSLSGLPFGIYGPGIRRFLQGVAENNGGIFISGAHVGTDLIDRPDTDPEIVRFAMEQLGYAATTNHASRTGEVFSDVWGGVDHRIGSDAPAARTVTADAQRTAGGNRIRPATGATGTDRDPVFNAGSFRFNTSYHPTIYSVDAPDAIKPGGNRSRTLLRYTENEFSAAVGYRGAYRVVVFGFPFETILGEGDRARVMEAILEYLQ